MPVVDWRDLEPGQVAPLYEAERQRWAEGLHWDLEPSIRILEEARLFGRLPGFVHLDETGRADGWTFFVLHDGLLQVGGVSAASATAVRALLQAVLASPDTRLARAVRCFLFPQSPSVASALERQHFALHRHLYLARDIASPAPLTGASHRVGTDECALAEVELADVVRLASRAYAGSHEATCFAPDGRLEQWAHYLGQLLNTPGVGWYLPRASFAIRGGDRGPDGAIVTSAIGKTTAHVAQVVVDPGARGRGLGRRLVERAIEAASGLGFSRMTLLVAEENAPARALYASLGFAETAAFLFGSRARVGRGENGRAEF